MAPELDGNMGVERRRAAGVRQKGPGPNWLLRGLILFSIGVHAFVFLHIAGIYRFEALTAIELTLRERERPAVRDIPRPRHRPERLPKPREIEPLAAQPRQMPDIQPMKMAPVDPDAPAALVETLAAPEAPRISAPPVAAWAADPPVEQGGFGTARDYFDMVRLRIESKKNYPSSARMRQVEGRVRVRFTIREDGSVEAVAVAESSRSRALDDAALDAVKASAPFPRPPRHLFSEDLPLEITILFELT